MNKEFEEEFIKKSEMKENLYKVSDSWGRSQFIDEILRLHEENKELKEVIEKAIAYMKENIHVTVFPDGYELYTIKNGNDVFSEKLLDILERVENNE